MKPNLPREHNLHEALARSLSIAASQLGIKDEARRYRLAEINARQRHLAAAVWGRARGTRNTTKMDGDLLP